MSFKSSIQMPTIITANHGITERLGEIYKETANAELLIKEGKEGAEGKSKAGSSQCSPVVSLLVTEPSVPFLSLGLTFLLAVLE